MSGYLPSPRRVAGALAVLRALPPAALADLAERLIDRIDALNGDSDMEPDNCDACPASDDDPALSRPQLGVWGMEFGPGEPDDAEAAPWEPGDCWTPTKGPAECCSVRFRMEGTP